MALEHGTGARTLGFPRENKLGGGPLVKRHPLSSACAASSYYHSSSTSGWWIWDLKHRTSPSVKQEGMAREALLSPHSGRPLITASAPTTPSLPPPAALPSRHEGTCQPADRDTAWPRPVAGHAKGNSEKGDEEEWRREGSSVSPPNQTNQGFPPQEGRQTP